jgi:peptide/nickel transport system substrate-binding protein
VWQTPTQDYDAIPNPYTGLQLPQRLDHADVVMKTGLPVGKTYDWVNLEFADDIVPPDDAWVDFDVVSETFLTVADWKDTVAVVDSITAAVADLAAGVDFATLDTDGVLAAMDAAAAAYTSASGNEIDLSALKDDATAVPEPPEDAGEDFDPRPLIEIRLEGIVGADDPAAELAGYAMEWLESADTANLFGFAARDFTSALRKVTYYYPESLWDITWHDGSNMSMGDFIMPIIMPYAMGRPASELFDPSQASSLDASLDAFKGQKIISTDPLVIEYYSDSWYGDAEADAVPFRTAFWPEYGYGQSGWSMIAVANKAEAAGELAYSADKADANEIEWMNWIGGPSLEILAAKLDEAIAENYIPFEPTLGQYVTADEAAARYANLKAFYEEYGHFWVGAGPYILKDVFLVEKNATLVYNPNFKDPADKWAMFSTPRVADVAVDGAGRVTIGEEATFDVFVTFEGEAYPAADVSEIKYLLFDAQSNLVEVGAATLVADGQYLVTLSAETTAKLESGANKLEVVAIVIPVSIPSIGSIEFVSE